MAVEHALKMKINKNTYAFDRSVKLILSVSSWNLKAKNFGKVGTQKVKRTVTVYVKYVIVVIVVGFRSFRRSKFFGPSVRLVSLMWPLSAVRNQHATNERRPRAYWRRPTVTRRGDTCCPQSQSVYCETRLLVRQSLGGRQQHEIPNGARTMYYWNCYDIFFLYVCVHDTSARNYVGVMMCAQNSRDRKKKPSRGPEKKKKKIE